MKKKKINKISKITKNRKQKMKIRKTSKTREMTKIEKKGGKRTQKLKNPQKFSEDPFKITRKKTREFFF